jgi:hypothetical protein
VLRAVLTGRVAVGVVGGTGVGRPRRRSWLVLCAVLDVLALSLVVLGVVVSLPLAFAGFVLVNVAVCLHSERRRQ